MTTKSPHVTIVYLYTHRDHKRGDVNYWSDDPIPDWMQSEWNLTGTYAFYTGETKLSGRTRIPVVTPEVQALRDELARATKAFAQRPVPALGTIIKRLERKLRYAASL